MSLSESQNESGLLQIQQVKSKDIDVIRHHYDFLIDLVSPEFGLVDKLYSNRTLSELQKDEIEATSIIHKRNKILLKYIIKKNACEKLFDALKECGQSHLVKYVELDGVYREELGGDWPLMEKERKILLDNYEALVDLIDCKDLVGLLYQTGVLNKRQRDAVSSSKWTTAEQNKLLLQILRKGSLDGYWQMIRCLQLSSQSHIAKIFESGGVIVRFDANLQRESTNLTEIEKSIVAEFTSILRQPYVSDANRLLEEVQLNLVAVAAKHSVSLYFLCSDLGEIDRLKQMTLDGQLKKFVEDLFNRLMHLPKRIKVTMKWSRHLFSKSRKHIEAIHIKNVIDEPKKKTIESLPLELLDTILQRAYLSHSVRRDTTDSDKDSDFIVFLGSVNALWLQIILRKRFKKPNWTQLEKIYRRKYDEFLKFRDCLHYLVEAIQVEELKLKRQDLVAADFLTDLQIAGLPRKRAKDKRRRRSEMVTTLAGEFFFARRGSENTNIYYKFIRYLRQTPIANVLERKGATAKVEIRQPKSSNTDSWSRMFSSRLNNLKEQHQLKSVDMKKIIQQLEGYGLEILVSFVDREVIVWIWCTKQNAVEDLKALYKSQILIEHLYGLANEKNDPNRSTKDIHLEDYSQLMIYTDFFSNLIVNKEWELEMGNLYENFIGVTKLKNKIFVLCVTDPNLTSVFGVCIFDDQHPFCLQREMQLDEIKDATDISSFEKNKCLYIVDIKAKCIWKIRPPDEDKIEDGELKSRALKCPALSNFKFFTMTVTVGGQIMIIGDRKPNLLFFESDSALNRPIRIDLPEAIEEPEQVSENLASNFICLHRTREKYWAVSEVDRKGNFIIRQFFRPGNPWLRQDGPTFLLVDSKDRIFLSDTRHHILFYLDSTLRHGYFYTFRENKESNIHLPWKMYGDGSKNQLIVAGKWNVFVFSLRGF